ncbi:hypothetical protein A2U01_0027754, partial [Trifolium medium]|nr:hypothetical protein [Trifolium medium]
LKKGSEVQRGKEQGFVFEPPPSPELPDADLGVVANEIQLIRAVAVELQPPPEPLNTDFSARISSIFDLQGGKEKVLVLKLPPELPNTDLFAMVMKIKHICDVTNKKSGIA